MLLPNRIPIYFVLTHSTAQYQEQLCINGDYSFDFGLLTITACVMPYQRITSVRLFSGMKEFKLFVQQNGVITCNLKNRHPFELNITFKVTYAIVNSYDSVSCIFSAEVS